MNANKENDKNTREVYEKVNEHYKGDIQKTNEWFSKENPVFGGKSPLNIIGSHNAKKLNDYVDREMRGKK